MKISHPHRLRTLMFYLQIFLLVMNKLLFVTIRMPLLHYLNSCPKNSLLYIKMVATQPLRFRIFSNRQPDLKWNWTKEIKDETFRRKMISFWYPFRVSVIFTVTWARFLTFYQIEVQFWMALFICMAPRRSRILEFWYSETWCGGNGKIKNLE